MTINRKRKQRGKSEAKQLHELSDTESANSGTIIDTPLINSYTIYMFFYSRDYKTNCTCAPQAQQLQN